MRQTIAWIAACLLLLSPVWGSAQESANVPEPGSYGFSFDLPSGGGTGFGIRRMMSPSSNLGVSIVVGYRKDDSERPAEPDETRTSWSIGLRPDLRLYRRNARSVLPFLSLEAEVGYNKQTADEFEASGFKLGMGVGVGAEWFPLEEMSISGSTGVNIAYRRRTTAADILEQSLTDSALVVGLFQSALQLSLYF